MSKSRIRTLTGDEDRLLTKLEYLAESDPEAFARVKKTIDYLIAVQNPSRLTPRRPRRPARRR
jgi:hypothetical protein